MPSLFRIDKNSITSDKEKESPGVVVLPGFEDLTGKKIQEAQHLDEEASAEEAEILDEDPEIAARKAELREIELRVAELQRQANTIVGDAKEQADRMIEEAKGKGYEDGFNEATASVRAEQAQQNAVVEDALAALKNAKSEVFEQIEDSVGDLAFFIAEHILKAELEKNDEAFMGIIKGVISKVQDQTNMIIKVSKTEYEKLFADPNSPVAIEMKNSGVAVMQDLRLESGECDVETEYGNIRAGVKTQLKLMEKAMEEGTTGQ